MHNELGLMQFTPKERALAQLFWYFLNQERKEYYQKQFEAANLISKSFITDKGFQYLNEELSKEVQSFVENNHLFAEVNFLNAAVYLKRENKSTFLVSEKAGLLHESFLKI